MSIVTKALEVVPIDAVRPHPDNPRRGDVSAIVESIKHNGFVGSLIVQRSSGFILAGSHRWTAARSVGLEEVPVLWAEVDDAHARRILLADNRTSDRAEYETDALLDLLKNTFEEVESLEGTGYTEEWLTEMLEKAGEVTDPPERPKKKRQSGSPSPSFDVTVYCGNSDAQSNLLQLLETEGYDYQAKGRQADD